VKHNPPNGRPRPRWFAWVECEHGYLVRVEVSPVWIFLPVRDTCPVARQREKHERLV